MNKRTAHVNIDTVQHVGVIIIQSLKSRDIQTGSVLFEETFKYKAFQDKVFEPCLYNVSSAGEMDACLKELIRKVKDEYYYIYLHIETHGADDTTGMALADGSFYSWQRLFDYTRQINILLGNNLAIMMAMCIGGAMISRIKPDDYAPFRFFIASFETVGQDEMIRGWQAFYENFLFSMKPVEAVGAMNTEIGRKDDLFHLFTDERVFEAICNPERDPVGFRKVVDEEHLLLMYQRNKPFLKRETVEANVRALLAWTRENCRDKFCFRTDSII